MVYDDSMKEELKLRFQSAYEYDQKIDKYKEETKLCNAGKRETLKALAEKMEVKQKALKEGYKKLPFSPKAFINSLCSAIFVTLHRPPPLSNNFDPMRYVFSRRRVFAPCAAALPAAISPAGPPPITRTS